MTKQEIIHLLKQALRDGDEYVIVQRGSYTQVGLRSRDGKQTSNITAAVCTAFGLPHQGQCAVASEAQIRDLLPTLQTPLGSARDLQTGGNSTQADAIPRPAEKKSKRQPMPADSIPDFDAMSDEDKIAWIVAHPDAISASKVSAA